MEISTLVANLRPDMGTAEWAFEGIGTALLAAIAAALITASYSKSAPRSQIAMAYNAWATELFRLLFRVHAMRSGLESLRSAEAPGRQGDVVSRVKLEQMEHQFRLNAVVSDTTASLNVFHEFGLGEQLASFEDASRAAAAFAFGKDPLPSHLKALEAVDETVAGDGGELWLRQLEAKHMLLMLRLLSLSTLKGRVRDHFREENLKLPRRARPAD